MRQKTRETGQHAKQRCLQNRRKAAFPPPLPRKIRKRKENAEAAGETKRVGGKRSKPAYNATLSTLDRGSYEPVVPIIDESTRALAVDQHRTRCCKIA